MATADKSVLLDTSIVVRHFRERAGMVSRLEAFEEIYLPFVVLGELYSGAFQSAQPEKNTMQIRQFLAAVDILLPDQSTLEEYGRISAQLAAAGTPIPQNDIWISAIAIQTGIPLVTGTAIFNASPA